MPWYMVTIRSSDVADNSASNLINSFDHIYRTSGVPDGVEVWHMGNADIGHVYLFSEKAAEIAKKLLNDFEAVPLSDPVSLENFRKVRL